MLKGFKILAVMAAVPFLTGCATIISGSNQKVNVNSVPSGAMAKVDGNLAAVTPTVFTLERKVDHTVEISKAGYRTASVILRHTMNGATAGNILAGGIIGIGVDALSGAMYKLVPDRVDVTLEKVGEVSEPQSAAAVAPEVVASVAPIEEQDAIAATATQTATPETPQTAGNFGPKK